MPTSITMAPGLIQSPGTRPGLPAATTRISACRTYVLEAGREAVADRGRRTHEQQLQRHRPADDVGSADDDGVLSLERSADVLEQLDDAVGRARPHHRNALREASDVVGMKAVDVLHRIDPLDDRGLLDLLRAAAAVPGCRRSQRRD